MFTVLVCICELFLLSSCLASFAAEEFIVLSKIIKTTSVSPFSIEEEFIARCMQEILSKNPNQIKGITLSGNHMDSDTFCRLTQEIDKEKKEFRNLKVLDISNNYLKENISSFLIKWLDKSKECYVNLCDNPIALSKIEKLYDVLQANLGETKSLEYMNRIIFMEKKYVYKARDGGVQIYDQLVYKKKIPKNWAQIHITYYKKCEFKYLKELIKLHQYKEIINQIKQIPVKSINSQKGGSMELDPIEIKETENYHEMELDFKNVIRLVAPPRVGNYATEDK